MLEPALDSDICEGVILQSFGAGNVPNEEPYSFTTMIRSARALNKPVIITSQFPAGSTLHSAYEPGKAAVDEGAISTGNMTSACALAKFRWALAQVKQRMKEESLPESDCVKLVDEIMQKDYVGEMN